MATGKNYLAKPAYGFLSGERDKPFHSEPMFEFDEADVWNSNHVASPEIKKLIPSSRFSKKSTKRIENDDRAGASAKSLPLNIPDWSKILREDYRESRREYDKDDYDEDVDETDGDGKDSRIPPHEFLARQLGRTRIASFSVHEGIGRTLKGRDLSRVRDAIWEKTGFED